MANWQPLEMNCEVINKYLNTIGLDVSTFGFQDLLSLEDWAQEMVQTPVLGLLFIYEITPKQEEFKKEEEERIAKDGQTVDEKVFYMKQYAGNACGTIGCFHILGNLPEDHQNLIQKDSLLAQFFESIKGKTPQEAGNIFNDSKNLKEKHVEATQEGATNVDDHQTTSNHFIAFIEKGGSLYELDGRKNRPINHGATSTQTFLADAARAAQTFILREPDNLNVGTIVLAPNPAN